jgi:hypothetical protein
LAQTSSTLNRALIRRIDSHDAFPITALEAVVQARRCLDEIERSAVTSARERGATWEDIAQALGVTRQAIYQKYRNGSYRDGSDPDSGRRSSPDSVA